MVIIIIFITIFTIIIVINILLIFLGVEYQLGHPSVFFSSSRCYFVRATNSIKFQSLNRKKFQNFDKFEFKGMSHFCFSVKRVNICLFMQQFFSIPNTF